jgi:4-hydroxy-4-methyl-2-oxoglutarate aldolase
MDYQSKIIDFCISNRVSTTEVSDAIGKAGVLEKITPLNSNHYCVGPARLIFSANNSNYLVHEQIRDVKKGEVIIICTYNLNERAVIGDLISKYLLLYKGVAAIVVQGLVRDVARLKKENYPIWSEGFSPLGCFNNNSGLYPKELETKQRDKYDGGVAICDDGGVTIIPRSFLNKQIFENLQNIEIQEDIWFYCLDTLKWDTKKIVCDKAYFHEQSLLSKAHMENLNKLSKKNIDEV